MSEIVVAKLIRLGKNGDKFDKSMVAETMRTDAKLDREFVEKFNETWPDRGQLYIIDEEATEKRNAGKGKKEAPVSTSKTAQDIADKKAKREQLKADATALGIEFPGNISDAKLQELINKKINE